MKKSLLLSIALLLTGLNLFAQWDLLPSGTTKSLHSVYFTDANTGYSVGDKGKILKTINGGFAWDSLSIGTFNLKAVYFPDANTGYAVGDSGTILKTINGGVTWDSLSSGTTYSLSSVYFIDADIGYAVGGEYFGGQLNPSIAIILKTTDGGANWATVCLIPNVNLFSVYFTGANTGYAVGYGITTVFGGIKYGIIFNTTDGGAMWNTQYSGPWNNSYCNSVFFPEANTGYAVGGNFTCLKTIDGGTTWTDLSNAGGNSVYFTSADTGYVTGNGGNILITYDAGTNWTTQPSGISDDLFSVFFNNTDTGYAVGNNGVILKTTNGGNPPVEIKEKTQTTSLKIYPNPAKEKIIIEPTESGSNMNGTCSIYGTTCQELIRQQVQGSKVEINVSSLPTGIYFIRLENKDKNEFGKFIKN